MWWKGNRGIIPGFDQCDEEVIDGLSVEELINTVSDRIQYYQKDGCQCLSIRKRQAMHDDTTGERNLKICI